MRLFYSLIGVSTLIIPLSFVSSAPYLQRYLYIVIPLLAFTGIVALYYFFSTKKAIKSLHTHGASFLLLVCVLVSFFIWHPPAFVYSLHPAQTAYIVWPQEQAGTQYVYGQVPEEKKVMSDIMTLIIYSYLDREKNPYSTYLSMGNDLHPLVEENPLLFPGDWIIRSKRQDMISMIAQDLGGDFWHELDIRLFSDANRIYDNGFVTIYSTKD
jgi:hypothetical protein